MPSRVFTADPGDRSGTSSSGGADIALGHNLVVETIPVAVWTARPNGDMTFLNPHGCELFGVPVTAVRNWDWLQLVHPDDRLATIASWGAALRDGTQFRHEYRLRVADGSFRWFLAQAAARKEAGGAVCEWVGTCTDINDLACAKDHLVRDAQLLASVRDAVFVTDADGIVTYWNEAACRTFGWSAHEMLGEPLLKRFPEDRRGLIAAVTAQILSGENWSGEFEDWHKDGSRIWIEARVSRILDAGGRPIGIIGVSHDITARKRAELERDRLNAHLRLQIDRMPLGYLMLDADLRVVDWNTAAERIFGYCKDDVLGMGPPFEKLIPPADADFVVDALGRLCRGTRSAYGTNHNLTKDGRLITCEWSNTPLVDADGTLLGIVSLAQDVTERQRAEDALRASETRFRQIAESIREVFWLTSLDKREMVYVSPAYETIWGRSCESLVQNPSSWLEAVHPDDRDRVARAVSSRQLSGEYDEEYRIVRPDGAIRWIRDRAFLVRGSDDRIDRIAGVAEDITARRQLEAQLQQAQKMEAVGQLAGGVAHDFNNLLTIITGYSELLLHGLDPDEPGRELLVEIEKAGHRAGGLTRQLLAFSRKQVLSPRVIDVNDVVRDTEKMLRRLIGEDIELRTSLDTSIGAVRVDAGQLEQVLLNLAVNARDAMPVGGTLTITTAATELPSRDHHHSGSHPPRRYVRLSVVDSGDGMSEEVRQHLFEPFFTTKPIGKGTGLGLAVVHGFVQQSGGEVDVTSRVGEGTCFTVYLPCIDQQPARADLTDIRQATGGNETILLVEDDDSVRMLTSRVLQRCGYDVIIADRPRRAIELARTHEGRIDLLITDVVMPAMGGRLLAEELRADRPDMQVLFISGYTDDTIVRNGVQHNEVAFLQKPFTPRAIAEKVREVLMSAATAGCDERREA